ncbi:hypothetical protein [Kibdelosporangium phytohabitans]|uniref:hypothetical protein n=1 Tax=Kibdelosporangium phytohabitans TaxID=860235 RepID=UPI0012FA647F|nr:hypothetical protein [Kibdelosporangium phytohabitans]MBE1471537.1 hypothetical protein [Kibdelosporangium phytohabitans]
MKPGLLVSIVAVIALIIAGAATIVLAANQPERPRDYPYTRETRDPSLPPRCVSAVEISFRTDAEMVKASKDLQNDTRFYQPSFMTQTQNYERLKVSLADQPDLLKALRPEAVPATAHLLSNYSDDVGSLVESVKHEYPSAKVVNPCDQPASSSKRPGPITATPRR